MTTIVITCFLNETYMLSPVHAYV